MKRRDFLRTGTAIGVGTLFTSPSFSIQNNSSRPSAPNILFIMTDQQTAQAMSCAGNNNLHTPNMDFLAQHGYRFTRAYCPQPLCGPSRSSIFTGRMPHEVNVINNLPQTPGHWTDLPMMGKLMKEAGYDTGYVGKWHLPAPVSEKELHGFDFMVERSHGDWADPSIPFDCRLFLETKREKPFLLVASFTNPHDICEWARGQALRQDYIGEAPAPDQCPELPDNFDIPEHEPESIREVQALSWKQYPTREWPADRWRQYRWAYNRMTEKVDYYIGMLLETLRKQNQLDNTLIIFTSDHGDGCGSHRWNQKQVLYEEVINVPFIISWHNKFKQTVNNKLIACGLDILPTMLDYAEQTQPEWTKGLSLKKLIEKNNFPWRDHLVVETEFAENNKLYGVSGRSLLTEKYKYTVYNKGNKREQLFNLDNDSGEMNDLQKKPEGQETLQQMRLQLSDWCTKNNDSFKL